MIYLDFDGTLAVSAELDLAFNRFTGYTGTTIQERMENYKSQKAAYDALSYHQQIDYWKSKGGRYIEFYQGAPVIAFARPNAAALIELCKELGPTAILTAGLSRYQKKIAHFIGLLNDIECYGRDDYDSVPKNPKNLLVDDLYTSTEGVQKKLTALGVSDNRHIYVQPWCGSDQEDEILLSLIPKIKALL